MESSSSTAEDACPVCRGAITDPSQPSPCCNKVFCKSCLAQSTSIRYHCPHCRTPLPGHGAQRPRRAGLLMHRLPGLADGDGSFRTAQPVGNNINALISQLRDARTQLEQMSSSSAGGPVSQASPAPAAQAAPPRLVFPILRRPIPRPRAYPPAAAPAPPLITAINPVAAAAPPAPLPPAPTPAPAPAPANSNPHIISDSSSDEFDEMAWRTEIELMEHASGLPPGPIVRTFKCPYCQEDGLDDLDLRDHCNDNHLSDPRRVVCPVCVSLPHGDPLFHSRDFIGHLNLRHCYYIQDITNVNQSDEVNLQAALLRSFSNAN
ncbi:SH3 domain-containing protein C23A1.17-like [Astyanax mexicanus]|uniref:E3 ubiquitin-protein ligase RNF138 n=1 Tax=Astyanax mexicanus TaxID=7994 RepID=A0A8B9JN94_ASTMX|nr:SH3 domain-containing protein C23A1.17-like [Astyanax mexicanus]